MYLSQEPLYILLVIICLVAPVAICLCRRSRRNAGRVLGPAPVVVTTTTQQVPFTPGPQMQQSNVYPHQTSYPMGQQGYGMPMPATNQQSYPMPQAGYPPYPAAAPYGGHENMNPPSYDQVVGTGTTTMTTTNETYAKQAPYNPSYAQ